MSCTTVAFSNDILKDNNCEEFIKIPSGKLLKPELRNQYSMPILKLTDKKTEKRQTENSIGQDEIFLILKGQKIFIDTAKEDREIANKFEALLNAQNIETMSLCSQPDNPSATFKDLTYKLKSCDIIVMFYDKSPSSWFKERLRYYRVVQVQRHEPIKHIFICSPQIRPIDKLPKKTTVFTKYEECFRNLNNE